MSNSQDSEATPEPVIKKGKGLSKSSSVKKVAGNLQNMAIPISTVPLTQVVIKEKTSTCSTSKAKGKSNTIEVQVRAKEKEPLEIEVYTKHKQDIGKHNRVVPATMVSDFVLSKKAKKSSKKGMAKGTI